MSDVETTEEKRERPIVIRNTTDLQRLKVEKLMKYPDKPVIIPERPKERGIPAVPDFVRNVMGSSAGAGSGEFHVYRHLRRKEYARQKYMKEKGERERMEQDYHDKIEENKKKAEQKTAKKRAKRLKRKQKDKGKVKKVKLNEVKSESSDEESDEVEQESTEHNEKSQTESANSHIGEEKCRSEDKMENYDVDLQKTDDISRNTEANLKSESLEEKDDDEVVQKVKNDENGKAECVSSIEKENGNGNKEQNCGENEKTNDISKSAEAKLDSESNVIKEHKLDKKTQNDEKDDEKVQDDTLQ